MDNKDELKDTLAKLMEEIEKSNERMLSLRDLFAAQAMQALLGGDYERFRDVAVDAYEIADVMITVREE